MPKGKDTLFVDDVSLRLQEEYSIVGFYQTGTKDTAMLVCDSLAQNPNISADSRRLAGDNLSYYLQPLEADCPSFMAKQIPSLIPGQFAMNPSVVRHVGCTIMNVRHVNYVIEGNGGYLTMDDDGVIRTRNVLVAVDDDLNVKEIGEIETPSGWPAKPLYDKVIGLEDLRLSSHDDKLFGSATVRELNPAGVCQQVEIILQGTKATSWRPMSDGTRDEKNWMPCPEGYVYRCGTVVESDGSIVTQNPEPTVADLRGGTQLVKTDSGYLAIVHEARNDGGKRVYRHRFVLFDSRYRVIKVSRPFVFSEKQIEFAAGMCWHANGVDLLISYGIRDRQAWIAKVAAEQVIDFLFKEPKL
jgi:predicted GH43/DUF377 family glycosyl hydrolase